MALFMEVLGVPPNSLIEKGCRSKKFFQDFTPKIKPNKKGKLRKPSSKKLRDVLKSCNEEFIDFLEKALKWNPEERLAPTEALVHPWVVNGLPE